MKKVTLAGVPEHFNTPILLALEDGAFAEQGIDLQFTTVKEGTGKMCQMLDSRETDLAILLTEGICKHILNGGEAKLVQWYTKTPLLWGVHVGYASKFQTETDLKGTVAAISRKGSGSELMSFVHATNMGWDETNLRFEIVHTIDGAVTALTDGTADYFMWEQFMTQPLVDQKIFRRLGVCASPWPCFVIAVNTKFAAENPTDLQTVLAVINRYTSTFKNRPTAEADIANRFHLDLEQVRDWLQVTEWSQEQITLETLNKIQNQLVSFNIIDKKGTFEDMVIS
ncbi:substrate-binding domain-containing protein [Flavobacterium aurantiibacter]|uniref:ABC transporter substrate-binding protein n=1 Tax=Flavobacterium aurantiibacter TaxID=2023067 RepID=A0A255ZQZ3_9FLAO|nr:substrate-binding domain-containing protein [Flavobacterium aurantiibacter]OYQ43829.1 ABC transporter substrate-binding protein [Flavobacterium aurantiibacter]